jgi:hypothetical protein
LVKDSPAGQSPADGDLNTFHAGALWLTDRIGSGGAGISVDEFYHGVDCA